MNTVIKVENLSKQYRLGQVGTGTLSHDLNRWWHRLRGKPDPYLKIGETNDRATKGQTEYVWALKDINFEVQQGEVLGIIGKNGAGKSTLLKILSKVTGPTTGAIKAKGRIASLLEVGTGFHPELTGRENIFLNGTILGMTKAEVKAKLDEIVAFAGVERYLDTPVKRYSSGMMVRLGFAVAAHLEPEILIVDEVLAVGDAEFQKKAIGKMQEVSTQGGRTVLFVSHNMGSVRRLCDRSVLLKSGKIESYGNTDYIVNHYLSLGGGGYSFNFKRDIKIVNQIISAGIFDAEGVEKGTFDLDEGIFIKVKYCISYLVPNLTLRVEVKFQDYILFWSFLSDAARDKSIQNKGTYLSEIKLPRILKPGSYDVNIAIVQIDKKYYDKKYNLLSFVISDVDEDASSKSYSIRRPGLIKPLIKWETNFLKNSDEA